MVASTTNPPSDEEIGDKKYPADSVINCLLQMHQLTAKPKENPCPFICPMCAGGTLNRIWRGHEKAATASCVPWRVDWWSDVQVEWSP
jgi:hypothetical protein